MSILTGGLAFLDPAGGISSATGFLPSFLSLLCRVSTILNQLYR